MDIFSFLREMFCEENQFLTNLGSIITIISGVSIFSVIVGVIKRVWSSLRHIYMRPDCLEKKEVTKYTRLYIKTRLKANDTMLSSRKKSYDVKKFIRKYLIKGDDQYHLIFGESGMGKTAFLINLYFIYNCKLFKKYDMYYVSLRSIDAIDQIKIFAEKNDPKKAILLLDAFDESKAASEDSSHAIKELLNITNNYCKVVISCRTQFFNAVNEEPQIVKLSRAVLVEDEMFVKHYICPFTDYEVLLYLLKYYKLNFWKIFRGKQVIKKSSNIMARPLLLSYIDDIVNEHEEYKYAYQIYETLIGKWIDREVHFIQKTSEKDIAISDYINNFWQFNADYIPNQIAPESEVQLGRVRGLTFNENEAINPYHDLESYIYHITANDPASEKALQMVIRMYHTGKGAPQSSVLSNYWSSYILPVDSSKTNYDNYENDYYDIQAELERKFDELFGSLNDDDVVQSKTVNDEPKNSMQEPQNTELDNLDLDLDNIITLNDEDGNPVQFEFLDLVEYQGKEYVILLPTEEDSEDSGEVVILEVIDTNEDEESYISVDNEENLQAVFNIFKEKFISEFDFID